MQTPNGKRFSALGAYLLGIMFRQFLHFLLHWMPLVGNEQQKIPVIWVPTLRRGAKDEDYLAVPPLLPTKAKAF
jgi:hypothetical protein